MIIELDLTSDEAILLVAAVVCYKDKGPQMDRWQGSDMKSLRNKVDEKVKGTNDSKDRT